jgi:hypothetical protein
MQAERRCGFRRSGGADARPMTARVESRLRFVSSRPEPGHPGLPGEPPARTLPAQGKQAFGHDGTLALRQVQGYFTRVDVRWFDAYPAGASLLVVSHR